MSTFRRKPPGRHLLFLGETLCGARLTAEQHRRRTAKRLAEVTCEQCQKAIRRLAKGGVVLEEARA